MASDRAVGDAAAEPVDAPAPGGDEKTVHVDQNRLASQIINDARLATEKESKMTLLQGIKLYPKAIAWSVLISTTIVMEGYDVALINNFCKLSACVWRGVTRCNVTSPSTRMLT